MQCMFFSFLQGPPKIKHVELNASNYKFVLVNIHQYLLSIVLCLWVLKNHPTKEGISLANNSIGNISTELEMNSLVNLIEQNEQQSDR